MAVLNFPDTRPDSSPLQPGDQYTGDNGITYVWDGVKWLGQVSAGGGGTANLGNFTFAADTITNGNGLILDTDRGTLAIGTQLEVPGVPQHFHIAFDQSNSTPPYNDLFLGDDYNYVKLPRNTELGVKIGTHNRDGGNPYNWTFGTDGVLTLPSGNTRIGDVFGTGADGIIGSTGTTVGVVSRGSGGYVVLQWVDDSGNLESTSTQVQVAADQNDDRTTLYCPTTDGNEGGYIDYHGFEFDDQGGGNFITLLKVEESYSNGTRWIVNGNNANSF